mmetsp:Transcript_30956/g.75535  ORF Transcript_30956/g.75535 Transcript_30956/m.75535 type:complete len:507 (-) Transcript_30956:446-1966(-)
MTATLPLATTSFGGHSRRSHRRHSRRTSDSMRHRSSTGRAVSCLQSEMSISTTLASARALISWGSRCSKRPPLRSSLRWRRNRIAALPPLLVTSWGGYLRLGQFVKMRESSVSKEQSSSIGSDVRFGQFEISSSFNSHPFRLGRSSGSDSKSWPLRFRRWCRRKLTTHLPPRLRTNSGGKSSLSHPLSSRDCSVVMVCTSSVSISWISLQSDRLMTFKCASARPLMSGSKWNPELLRSNTPSLRNLSVAAPPCSATCLGGHLSSRQSSHSTLSSVRMLSRSVTGSDFSRRSPLMSMVLMRSPAICDISGSSTKSVCALRSSTPVLRHFITSSPPWSCTMAGGQSRLVQPLQCSATRDSTITRSSIGSLVSLTHLSRLISTTLIFFKPSTMLRGISRRGLPAMSYFLSRRKVTTTCPPFEARSWVGKSRFMQLLQCSETKLLILRRDSRGRDFRFEHPLTSSSVMPDRRMGVRSGNLSISRSEKSSLPLDRDICLAPSRVRRNSMPS